MVDDITALSGGELGRCYARAELSPVEVARHTLERIEAHNPTLNAYTLITTAQALAEARASEARWRAGTALGPLDGVPISLKDLFLTKGVRTTRGSHHYADDIPTEDAPTIERLRAAGVVAVGKTATPEFGWKGVTDSPLQGVTVNPWATTRTSGGSSGGAGAAVAALLGPLALGTDAGGSIRIPASFCGIVGLKPSLGRVPVWPASATEMLSVAGPMTRTVEDAALLLDELAGPPDPRDHLALPADPAHPYSASLDEEVAGLRLAWAAAPAGLSVAPAVAARVEESRAAFAALGCQVEPVELDFDGCAEVFSTLWICGRATAIDGWSAEQVAQLDPLLRDLIGHAASITGSEVIRALARRAVFAAEVHSFFMHHDALVLPTLPLTAFAAGHIAPPLPPGWRSGDADGRVPWLWWTPFTYPFNITGHPAISVPCGFDADGLPVGLQIVGRRFDDAGVLRLAAAFERARPWRHLTPPGFGQRDHR